MKQIIQASREREVLSLISGITFSSTPVWYDATRRDLKMDVLFPKHHTQHKPCPAIIWVCGGAFQSVDRSVWIPELEGFARAGYVVASIEYRLSGEASFPAALIDCKAAVRYLRAHASALCIDPERIFIMGESAGGCLASLVGVTAGMQEYEQGDWLEFSSRVQAVVDYYGVVQMPPEPTHFDGDLPYWTLEAFVGANYRPEQAEAASAVSLVGQSTPPVMILHGTADAIVPIELSRLFYDRLTAAGIRAEYLELEGAEHGDDAFYQPEIQQRILDFLGSI